MIPRSRVATRPSFRNATARRWMSVTVELGFVNKFAGCDRNVVVPEDVIRECHDSTKNGQRLARRTCAGKNVGVGRNADESTLRLRTRRPTVPTIPIEPTQRRPMMNVVGPRQRDQKIYVQQRNHAYSSSSAAQTCSSVIGAASVGTSKTGNPERVFDRPCGARPRRARSERAFPMFFPSAAATLRAA